VTTERIDIVVSEKGADTVSRKIAQIEGIRRVIGLSDAYTDFKNRVSVVTKSQDELKVVMGKVYDIAQRSRSGLQETGDLYTRIALSSKSLGISQNEALQMTESVNKAIILSGASTQEASAGMIQFGQALASGRLRGDELRSIMEQLPMVADIIARHLGVTRGELWALGHQGKITSLDLVEAFRDAREEIEEVAFSDQILVSAGSLITLQDFGIAAFQGSLARRISLILAIRTKGQSLLKTSSKGSKSKMSFWP
jgi:tape measure domain-containing protein